MMKNSISIMIIGILIISSISSINAVGTSSVSITASQNSEIESTNAPYDNINKLDFVPGEIIVKFKDNVKISVTLNQDHVATGLNTIDSLNEMFKINSVENLAKTETSSFISNVYKLKFNQKIPAQVILNEYLKDPNVEYAEPNYIAHTCIVPDDPLFDQQWALNQSNDCDIDAPEAWDVETGGNDVVIAILDTGVDYNHLDLVNNIWRNIGEIPDNGIDDDANGFIDDIRGWNFTDNGNNNPMDTLGHGTHCAGIVSADSNNSIGISGVCWNCKIMPVKLSNGGSFTEDASASGIKYAADNGADVISMSWGGTGDSQLIHDAIKYAYSKGVVLVAAAGNSNSPDSYYPSGYNEVISVSATDRNDTKAKFSNYGYSVDVAAPGVDILSLRANGTDMYGNGKHIVDNDYYLASGTSMACPFVAGLAGLLLSKNPDLNHLQVKTIIVSSTDEVNSQVYIGTGRINAYEALQKTGFATAFIDHSINEREVKGELEIIGYADGEHFQNYTLEYGRTKSPETWNKIVYSEKPVTNSTLSIWDTTKVEEGWYAIRLQLYNNFSKYEDKIWVLVNNVNNIIFVDDDNINGPWDGTESYPYEQIQTSVDNAGSSDKVFVKGGYYYNNEILINKKIELIGENKETTIIDVQYPITISSNNVKLSGFTLVASAYAIEIFSSYNTITGNVIKSRMPHNSIGITIVALWAVGIYSSGKVVEIIPYGEGNVIANNIIIGNMVGIQLAYARNTTIYHNNFIDNFEDASSSSITIFIINKNLKFPFMHKTKFLSRGNKWYCNYWDDWVGLKYKALQRLPKCIEGTTTRILEIGKSVLPLSQKSNYNFDWHPLLKPYEV